MANAGLIIAGLSSSSGKTFTTLGLLRALKNHSAHIAAAKTGPDYIDPGFHSAALGAPSVNLDGFAMSPNLICHLAHQQTGDVMIIEGVMGLYDGGDGSAVSLAQHLGAPMVLVLDIRGQSETAGEVAAALQSRLSDSGITLAGIILNRSKSPRHGEGIANHCRALGVKVLGIVPECDNIEMPSRHLGLVQAVDLAADDKLETLLDQAAKAIGGAIDLDAIISLAKPLNKPYGQKSGAQNQAEAMPPLGQSIALAHDAAFGFSYSHMIEGWRRMGAEVKLFSPLADEAPAPDADAIFLPGGYPELHLPQLANAHQFKSAMQKAAQEDVLIYGECGGYMVLGEAIISAKNERIPMLGLLKLETSFAEPKRVLGYRHLSLLDGSGLNLPAQSFGHEFHFTKAIRAEGDALFQASDKAKNDLGKIGLRSGKVAGSYAHIIAEG